MTRLALLTVLCLTVAASAAGFASAAPAGPLRVTEAQMGQMIKTSRRMPMTVLRADCYGLGPSIARRFSFFQCYVDSPRRRNVIWFIEMTKVGWTPSLL